MLFGHLGEKHRVARHVGLTVAIAGLGLLIALVVPDISTVFELMGGTASAYVCFIMPAAFGLRLHLPEASGPVGSVACRALLLGGILVGIVATAVTTVGLFDARPPGKGAHTGLGLGPCEAEYG